MKKILFIVLFPAISWAGNIPEYYHEDKFTQLEFENVGFEIQKARNKTTNLRGTSTNDSASTGYLGEYVSSTTVNQTNCPSSGSYGDAASISLTAGDWDVSTVIVYIQNGATWTASLTGISSTSGNSGTGLTQPENLVVQAWTSSSTTPEQSETSIPRYRVSINSTTTYYAKVRSTYSAGQPKFLAFMSARRVR